MVCAFILLVNVVCFDLCFKPVVILLHVHSYPCTVLTSLFFSGPCNNYLIVEYEVATLFSINICFVCLFNPNVLS